MEMLTFTEVARAKVREYMARGIVEDPALRIVVPEESSPLALEYSFELVESAEAAVSDTVLEEDGFRVLLDPATALQLEGGTVDFVEAAAGSGFQITPGQRRPGGNGGPTGELAERIRRVIEERVNPGIAAHGGHVDLVDLDEAEGVACVQMLGGCQGCGLAKVTLTRGVERMIRELVPEVTAVRDVTDHARGENPFYRSEAR
jgi:Fe/S biogenesis protein NfuA